MRKVRPDALASYRSSCRHVLIWLHQSRLSIRDVGAETLNRFRDHDCVCPGPFERPRPRKSGASYLYPFTMFMRYLVETGVMPAPGRSRRRPGHRVLRPMASATSWHRCADHWQVVDLSRTALVSGSVWLFRPAPAKAISPRPSASPWSRTDTACSSSQRGAPEPDPAARTARQTPAHPGRAARGSESARHRGPRSRPDRIRRAGRPTRGGQRRMNDTLKDRPARSACTASPPTGTRSAITTGPPPSSPGKRRSGAAAASSAASAKPASDSSSHSPTSTGRGPGAATASPSRI